MNRKLKKLIEKKGKLFEQTYEIIDGFLIKIYSDSEKGTMRNYFSQQMIITKENAKGKKYVIYNISNDLSLEASFAVTERMKRLEKGYYNLHHFGSPIKFFIEDEEYYFQGNVKDCNIAIWTFFIKWLLTFEIGYSDLHLKGTGISHENKGILFIGDKGAGKSSFIYELSKRKKVKMIANTHILIDNKLNMQGVYSKINFRENMAQNIKNDNLKMKNYIINGCTNIDPDILGYERIKECKIDKIVFYQYNEGGKCEIENIDEEKMTTLIRTYAYGLNFYALRTDLMDYCNRNVLEVSSKLMKDENVIKQLVHNTRCFIANIDVYNEKVWSTVLSFLSNTGE